MKVSAIQKYCFSRLLLTSSITPKIMYPPDIVQVLNKHIIGQEDAKKAIAVSIRNRWRRKQLKDEAMKEDILPKNILMIGQTGVGKTEIARRMAKITDAPFIKVEATKYSEVGFKGKDVESIIEDLYGSAKVKVTQDMVSEKQYQHKKDTALLLYEALKDKYKFIKKVAPEDFIRILVDDDGDTSILANIVSLKLNIRGKPLESNKEFLNVTDLINSLIGLSQQSSSNSKMPPFEAKQEYDEHIYIDMKDKPLNDVYKELCVKTDQVEYTLDKEKIADRAKQESEDGIVFIDEIDKIVTDPAIKNYDGNGDGIQQDLLPILEGTEVTLNDGTVIKTDNILFICSGAFHSVKPSDIIAELQGRLPVRVKLNSLSIEDIYRILTEPQYNLLKQHQALFKTEGIDLEFSADSIKEIANITSKLNASGQNIGARRIGAVCREDNG